MLLLLPTYYYQHHHGSRAANVYLCYKLVPQFSHCLPNRVVVGAHIPRTHITNCSRERGFYSYILSHYPLLLTLSFSLRPTPKNIQAHQLPFQLAQKLPFLFCLTFGS